MRSTSMGPKGQKSDSVLKSKSLLHLHEIPCPGAKNNKAPKSKSFGTPRFGWDDAHLRLQLFPCIFPRYLGKFLSKNNFNFQKDFELAITPGCFNLAPYIKIAKSCGGKPPGEKSKREFRKG